MEPTTEQVLEFVPFAKSREAMTKPALIAGYRISWDSTGSMWRRTTRAAAGK